MIAVATITLADIKSKPITSSCSSSSSAGNENTAMNTRGACRLNRNILAIPMCICNVARLTAITAIIVSN